MNNKKILIIFHLNFLKNDMGCSSYVYEIARYLKGKGFSIDFLSNAGIDGNFDNFAELNAKEKLIDNFYLFKPTKYNIKKKLFGLNIIKTKYKIKKQKRYIKTYIGILKISTKPDKKYYSTWVDDEFVKFYNNIVNSNHYDYINIHYIQFADLIKYGNTPSSTKKIYSMQDANYVQQFYCQNQNVINPIEQEIELVNLFDEIMSISMDEKQFFEKLLPNKKFYFLPPLVPQIPQDSNNNKDIDILFLGHSNPYNLEGIIWFLEKVYPLLKHKKNIWIVGKVLKMLIENPQYSIDTLNKMGINTIEFADDLDELYKRTKIAIVPIFRGTGMKIKTIDAMSRGIPVVATFLGVDGLPDKNRNGCLVSDLPEVFADYIDKLLDDKQYYQKAQNEIIDYFKHFLSAEKSTKTLDSCFKL